MEGDKELNFKIEKVVIGVDEDGDEVSSAVIEETGPILGDKQKDILNIIIAHEETGIVQNQIIRRLKDEGKPSHQPNVSRDLAKLEERKCIHKLNNSYFPIAKSQ